MLAHTSEAGTHTIKPRGSRSVRTTVSLSLDTYSADLLTRPRPIQINSWLWCERFSPSIGSSSSRSQTFWFSTESTGPAVPSGDTRWPATPRESSSCCPPRRRPPKRSARPASVSRLARLKIFAHGSHMTTCCFCYCWKMNIAFKTWISWVTSLWV